ncbi:sugar nucleotide-binding protein [Propionicicella superfundia]|uniref:sugar nucleotide-binding protein n=1 Tax=Propionicicella superfundia TaxID=348582 RepID=UPI00040B4A34|nr:bifunctional dTDP-4-dehydrorhamnose 3,5-epimerase family protein/NAD(P)-dependent oxidoreductase [Propionicicella superfundia]
MADLSLQHTAIPGLLRLTLPVHGDARGWFKEAWQREKMTALGLPDFGPVQANQSFNADRGTTRGLHAEPWDKLVSVAAGRIFGAWVDLRPGPGFGRSVSFECGPETAVFVPRGVANGFQSLAPDTVYTYLVNDHWSPAARSSYAYVNLADEQVAVPWPIPLAEAIVSDADRTHPRLRDVTGVPPRTTVVLGANGQLGRALRALLPGAVALTRDDLDLGDPAAVAGYDWRGVATIVNAAAYTAVDAAETNAGRAACWATNVTAVARLVEIARRHRIHLVQPSSEYVFDGTRRSHPEDEAPAPLGAYGQSKAAGDALVATLGDRYHIVRTSWVFGDGRNFVRTMEGLARSGRPARVVADQTGRLTYAPDLAAAIVHLLFVQAPAGVYNVTNSGPVQSWADIAADVFELCGRDRGDVTPISTEDYVAGRAGVAPRPRNSTLDLDKLAATGFEPVPARRRLAEYLA